LLIAAPPPWQPTWQRLGLATATDPAGRLTAVRVTVYPVPVLSAVPPLLWIWLLVRRRWVRRSRAAKGECLACGYDLRASRAAGRCPECGAGFRG